MTGMNKVQHQTGDRYKIGHRCYRGEQLFDTLLSSSVPFLDVKWRCFCFVFLLLILISSFSKKFHAPHHLPVELSSALLCTARNCVRSCYTSIRTFKNSKIKTKPMKKF